MFIGYNIQKANEAMASVNDAYVSVSKKVVNEWNEVKGVLRKEWVGADEQDFEKLVQERVQTMLESSRTLTSNTVDSLYELAVAWAKFQDTNTINGNNVGIAQTLIAGLNKPQITIAPQLVFVPIQFDSSTNLGLANSGSDDIISNSLSNFVKNVKTEATNLYESVDTNSAFYGNDQQNKLKKLMDTVGEAVGVISTSLKDFEKAMKELTNKAYKSSDDAVGASLDEARTTVDNSLNDLGETRWK